MNQNQEIEEFSLQKPRNDVRELKLPKIQRAASRGTPLEVKSSTKLPTIRSENCIEAPEVETERRVPEQEDVLGQVDKKLRMIMEEQNILQIEECGESDEDNFQKKIHQNKELLKKVRKQQQRLKKENQQLNKVASHFNPVRKVSHKNHKNDNFQKRIREYGSPQNIYASKKRGILGIGQKNSLKENSQREQPRSNNLLKESNVMNLDIRQVHSKEQLVNANKVMNWGQNKQSIQHDAPNDIRKLKKQFSHKFLTPLQKNEQLFDAIHNYLDNPKPSEFQCKSQKILKERSELEEKLKQYEGKLSQLPQVMIRHKHSAKTEILSPKENCQKTQTLSHWRKIGLSDRSSLVQESSNFDKEVDKIGQYFQRNEKSLERYVQNQKILVDMQVTKRKGSNEKHSTEKLSSI